MRDCFDSLITLNQTAEGEIKMENMIPLTPEELEQASGGTATKVRIKSAEVRSGPSLNYPVIATLTSGVTVNYMSHIADKEQEGVNWYMINKPTNGWVNGADLGL